MMRPKSSTWIELAHLHHESACRARRAARRCRRRPARAAGRRTPRSRSRRGPTPARRAAAPVGWVASARPSSTSRAGPVGSVSARSSATSTQADPLEDARRPSCAGSSRVARPQRLRISAGDEDVLAGGERAEHLEPLERAGDARAGPAGAALERGDVVAVERDTCRRRWRCRPVMTLNSVVLPAPLGPIRPGDGARARRRGRRRSGRCCRRSARRPRGSQVATPQSSRRRPARIEGAQLGVGARRVDRTTTASGCTARARAARGTSSGSSVGGLPSPRRGRGPCADRRERSATSPSGLRARLMPTRPGSRIMRLRERRQGVGRSAGSASRMSRAESAPDTAVMPPTTASSRTAARASAPVSRLKSSTPTLPFQHAEQVATHAGDGRRQRRTPELGAR